MAFSNAAHFRIDRSTFNDVQGDINYRIQRNYNHHIQGDYFNQHINVHRGQDTRGRIHSAMRDHIHTDAFHDSGARRDPSRCYPGTREAALQIISDWIRDSASRYFWLHGPAGTGKSAIAQTLSEKCHQDGTLGATYFFTKGSTGGLHQGPPPLFSTIAYQLMSVFPGLDDHLLAVIDADRTIFKRSLSAQLDRLIVQPLLKLTDTYTSTVVIIDGLDECDGDSTQGEIVRLILGLERYLLPILFLISSRPEPVIRRAFESFPRTSLVRLPLDKTLHPDRDIHHFLVNEFKRIYQQCVEAGMPPVSRLPWPSPEDIDILVQKSSGHFVYAATVIRFVQEDHAHPMDRLDTILRIAGESVDSSAAGGIFSTSTAFQELDSLYLHILRKCLNQAELGKILRAIMHFGQFATASNIEICFNLRPGSICIMLEGLHSIIDVPAHPLQLLQFLHASFSDFLADPKRSREFHLEINRFNAELACAYMRLIVDFSPIRTQHLLDKAMEDLGRCLKATTSLLPDTLRKLITIVTQESKSTLPCLLYIILDFLLRMVLKGFPEAKAKRKHCEAVLEQLEPQLVGLSGKIFTVLRVLGADKYMRDGNISRPECNSWLIGVHDGEEVFKQVLNINYYDLAQVLVRKQSFRWVYKSLYRWLLARYRPSMQHPAYVAVHEYTWAWAWDTHASRCSSVPESAPDSVDSVHNVDLMYGCLRLMLLEFSQPLNPTPPLILQGAFRFIGGAFYQHRGVKYLNFEELIEAIDFTSILRALPNLTTTFCPKLFYLHRGLDGLYDRLHFDDPPLHGINAGRPIPHCQKFLEAIYSRLLQGPLTSYVVLVMFAMFRPLPPQAIARLLGLAPEMLRHSAAMQSLFGAGLDMGGGRPGILPESYSLGVLLGMGRVKFRGGYIDDYIPGAHEYLAFSCVEHLALCIGPERNFDEGLGTYVKEYWSSHLRRARPSERLFGALRQVGISRPDIEPVIQWLEESPNTPPDILARWHAARIDSDMMHGPPLDPGMEGGYLLNMGMERGSLLDRIFQRWLGTESGLWC